MLVAYGPDNQPVIAHETTLEQLQRWSRERVLRCPNCRGIVHVRSGAEKQVHFAHQRGECAWSTETESVRHVRGKLLLAQWVRVQFPQAHVSLEERLAEPNRIADIFVAHLDGQQWAIEFQCAPLDYAEWKHRHEAYRKAHIHDIWIIGNNRREKHESFIEAIFVTRHELLFLDPQATPARIWLQWLVPSNTTHHWQHLSNFTLEQRGIRGDYRATLTGTLNELQVDMQCHILHTTRTLVEHQAQLLQKMQLESCLNETTLIAYLRPHISDEAIRVAFVPLVKSYIRDPDLLRRYNYGRGLPGQQVSESDIVRIQKARQWLLQLSLDGYKKDWWQTLVQYFPDVGPYVSFTRYIEMLLALQ